MRLWGLGGFLAFGGLAVSGASAQQGASVAVSSLGLTPESIGALSTGVAAIVTAFGGIIIAMVTRPGAATERNLQEKIALLEAKDVQAQRDITRLREERGQAQIASIRSESEREHCEREKNRIYFAARDYAHEAKRVLFNAIIAGSLRAADFALPDFPDIATFDEPKQEA